MKNLLAEIVKTMVNYPDQVKVNKIESEQTILLELSIAKQDIGIILGKKGQNIDAIRIILNAAAVKLSKRVVVKLLE